MATTPSRSRSRRTTSQPPGANEISVRLLPPAGEEGDESQVPPADEETPALDASAASAGEESQDPEVLSGVSVPRGSSPVRRVSASAKSYPPAPEPDYELMDLGVGMLCHAVDTEVGCQRDTPLEEASNPEEAQSILLAIEAAMAGTKAQARAALAWERALEKRFKDYEKLGGGPGVKAYRASLVFDRIVSLREDGVYYTIDGNGSNHWYRKLFGPDHAVRCRVIRGLSLSEENDLFQAIQLQRRSMTAQQRYRANVRFDVKSAAYKVGKAMHPTGWVVSNKNNNPSGVGFSAALFVYERYGASGLRDTVAFVKKAWPVTKPERSLASVFMGVALAIHNGDLDRSILLDVVSSYEPKVLSGEARGKASGNIVLAKIQEAYDLEVQARTPASEQDETGAGEDEGEGAAGMAPAVPPVVFESAQGGDPEVAGPETAGPGAAPAPPKPRSPSNGKKHAEAGAGS